VKKRTVHIVSLGCPKNQVDAEVMAALLAEKNFRIVPRPDDADVILVNTCAFILPAKEEAIEEILRMARWKEKNKNTKLVATGCLPQRYGKTLTRELPEVDLFLGISEIPHIARHIDGLFRENAAQQHAVIGKPSFLMSAAHPRLLPKSSRSAYIKIADGCSNRCSYCIIPAIRGKARSRPLDDILMEAEGLARRGVREIILTAQDTTVYGRDLRSGERLSDLLKGLASLTGLDWIRLLYAHPAHLKEDTLKTIAGTEKICSYIDIPVQHIDDDILEAMNRRGGSAAIRGIITRARALVPGVALRTSLIVGFPGETAGRFNRLLDFVREMRFDHLGVFPYSREEDTQAAALPSRISDREKQRRRNLLMEEQAVISYTINQTLIGSHQDVLIEAQSDRPDYPFVGRCRRQSPEIDGVTYVRGNGLTIGDLAPCEVVAASEYDIFAKVL
jgi:ribosomal protein S12 methylthiotransferase